MRKTHLFIFFFCISVLLCSSCKNDEPKNLLLNKTEVVLSVGESFQLTTNLKNSDNSLVSWRSKNEIIASVDDTGLVTALIAGETFIYASAEGKEAECKITVRKKTKCLISL